MFELKNILRPNIASLTPYSSAREEFKGEAEIYLDANENAIGSATNMQALNRYPDPLQIEVKEKLGKIKDILPANIFLGNGSDEAIDILMRAFCNPGKDNIIILPPTYGMYEVAARINDIAIQSVNLSPDLQINLPEIKNAINKHTKLIFVCSPNNPTGGVITKSSIGKLLAIFQGVVVVDEAYIDFADTESMIKDIGKYPNLVILQTFSKAWGLAGLRAGMAFAGEEIINVMNKIKAPYNVGVLVQKLILEALDNKDKVSKMIEILKREREIVIRKISEFSFIKEILPSQANFILVKTSAPVELYDFLIAHNLVVRNRSTLPMCEGGLRITIGTPDENKKLISLLSKFQPKLNS